MRSFRREFTCCDQCFDFLARKSTNLAVIWLEMCAEYHHSRRPLPFREESEVLTFLEKYGYIISIDDHYCLWVIPQKLYCENDQEFFCMSYSNHSEEWELE